MALTYSPELQLGSPCPDFELKATDGNFYKLNDFKNQKPLVVMFICNHCPYVKAIEERLIILAQDLKKLSVNVIAICSNDELSYPEDNFENLKLRAEQKKYPFHYLHDITQETAHKFGAVCTPDFFVYDQDLKLAYRGRLDDSWKDESKVTKRELYQAVLKLLDDQPAPISQIPSMGCSIKWIGQEE